MARLIARPPDLRPTAKPIPAQDPRGTGRGHAAIVYAVASAEVMTSSRRAFS